MREEVTGQDGAARPAGGAGQLCVPTAGGGWGGRDSRAAKARPARARPARARPARARPARARPARARPAPGLRRAQATPPRQSSAGASMHCPLGGLPPSGPGASASEAARCAAVAAHTASLRARDDGDGPRPGGGRGAAGSPLKASGRLLANKRGAATTRGALGASPSARSPGHPRRPACSPFVPGVCQT
jgi:hypothetical protein